MNIGRNTLYFRQQQGLTQQQLADALGISLMQFMAYSEGVELSAGHFQNADLLTTAQKESIEAQIRYAAQRYYDACLCANASCDNVVCLRRRLHCWRVPRRQQNICVLPLAYLKAAQ